MRLRRPARDFTTTRPLQVLMFLLAHVPLALVIRQFPVMGIVHALVVAALGLWWALPGRNLERVAYVGAYITGAEVLWRMTEVGLFWEFAKYAVAGIFLVALVRSRAFKPPVLPLLYFALLLPSTLQMFSKMGLDEARQQISFNLSGPLALLMSAWFFSKQRLTPVQFNRLFLALMGPVVGIAAVALFGIATGAEIRFNGESNAATSGGFAPNQVSAALGLAAMAAFLALTTRREDWRLRIFLFGSMVVFGAQSALTFSRGGLYCAFAGALGASLCLMQDSRARMKVLLAAGLVFLIAQFFILPKLDAFTGGALADRFEDTSPTNRDMLVEEDLEIWKRSPIFGVGPGGADAIRKEELFFSAAHTEFTRLIAEHGIFGMAALVLLLAAGYRRVQRARTPTGKAVVVAFIIWTLLFMLVNAMRLVAPSLAYGLCFAAMLPETAPALAVGGAMLKRLQPGDGQPVASA
jgi:O-antigen ligase